MFKTTLSAVRRATLVGVGAVSLALGASMLSAPAASAYVQLARMQVSQLRQYMIRTPSPWNMNMLLTGRIMR